MSRKALLSVSDKTDLIPLARTFVEAGITLISTGGTAKALREAGLKVDDVSDLTGFPEMMDGRVKTLHPKVHGGLLFLRGDVEHEAQAKKQGIEPIDFVVVNLYPFASTIAKAGVTLEEAIENIDIGGPSMLRSAAKNYRSVTVVVDPADYSKVAEQVKTKGETTIELRKSLATKVFEMTGAYDQMIGRYLSSHDKETELFPAQISMQFSKAQNLRYGENPHQQAALYGDFAKYFEQLHGKELSYNNLIDISAAVNLINEFKEKPTVAILKHTNPCGVGTGITLREAWELALATDRQAPFGGIIIVNRPLDLSIAEAISEIFSEVIIAPAFLPDAKELLSKKKNLRLIIQKEALQKLDSSNLEIKSIVGSSYLLQTADNQPMQPEEWKVVTKREPTAEEKEALLFGWRVVKHLKSNAIVYAAKDRTLGLGAGQMSRIDSSRIAIWKAGEAKLSLKGSVVASDAFFPFADGLIAAAEAGATAAIQPGGSTRDEEVIAAANKYNLAMLFTGRRHFRH